MPIGSPSVPDRVPEPVFWTDDAPLSAPLAHGEDIAAHFHDYGQLRYAAAGALVTTTEVGTWVAPANRIAWVPPFFVHRSRSFGQTDVHVLAVPAPLAERLPPDRSPGSRRPSRSSAPPCAARRSSTTDAPSSCPCPPVRAPAWACR